MIPGLRLSRATTAHKAAKDTMTFPTNSRRTASHLNKEKKDFNQYNEEKCFLRETPQSLKQ